MPPDTSAELSDGLLLGSSEGTTLGIEEGSDDGWVDSDGTKLGSDVGLVEYDGFKDGRNDGWVDSDGTKLGCNEGTKLGCEEGLQSFPQKGPKSACTGSLVNVQSVPVKILVELL